MRLVSIGPSKTEIVRVLQEVSGRTRAQVIEALREVPFFVAAGVDPGHAQWIRARLEAFDAEVEVE